VLLPDISTQVLYLITLHDGWSNTSNRLLDRTYTQIDIQTDRNRDI
jgi:hypothetical protein